MKRYAIFVLCSSAAIVTPFTALAQVEPEPHAVSEPPDTDDIVVTARKRSESLISVPVIANLVSGDTLERMQTNDLKALATLVPGLSLGTSILSVGTLVSLRGVGTSALDPGVDASVALNIDGLSLSQGLAYSSGMFDVGQVEVLKGPQVLFFGKSSPGGVISLRTNDPSNEFELIARAGYEIEARTRRIDAVASGPISETIKARLAAQYEKSDGFFYNYAEAVPGTGASGPSSRRNGAGTSYKIRGTVILDPSDTFNARIKINRAFDNFDNVSAIQNVVCPDGTAPVGRQYIDPDDCRLDRNSPSVDLDPAAFPNVLNDGVPYNRTVQTFGTVEMNFRIQPEITITSQTGYYFVRAESLFNATTSSAAQGLFNAVNNFYRRDFSQELRMTSDYSGPFNFTLGGLIQRGSFGNEVTIARNLIGFPLASGAAPTQIYIQKGEKDVEIKTDSVYGQVLYKVTPHFEAAVGARWTHERREETGAFLVPTTGAIQAANFVRPMIEAKNLAPEFTLSYRPSNDVTVFGSFKKGFKSGSFNVSTPPVDGEDNSFGDETVKGGEFGVKARSGDRRLHFNAAAFYYEYAGLQVGANVQASAGVSVTRTVNAGAARAYGLEADIAYRPTALDGLTLRIAGLYNNTKYTSLTNLPCYGGQMVSEGCNLLINSAGFYTAQDRSGLPLIRAPKYSGNFGADYEFSLSNDMTVVLTSNSQWQSRSLVNLGYLYYQPRFLKTDLGATLRGDNSKWEFSLTGKNLSNRITTGNCSNSNRAAGNAGGTITGGTARGPAGIEETGCYADVGREVWLRATLRY